jgi:endonuclease-3
VTKKERALNAIEILKKEYPEAICSLNASNPFELLVAVRLSAQCTDARVNQVTPSLFAKYKTLDDYANANLSDVEELVKSCGFYKNKASSIIGMAKMIISDFDGKVPDNIDDLIKLPGVGRKTANLIVGDIYGKESIVVDTHMIRISNRIGLVAVKEPVKIEMALKKIVPPDEGSDFCHRIVLFGRDICTARKPKCDSCPMNNNCKKIGVK